MEPDAQFKEAVYAVVARIPAGRVMTYGQIAALCGSPRAARIVGGLAHFGPVGLPWQRVVNKTGGMASGYPGGQAHQAELLTQEGIVLDASLHLDIDRLMWWPEDL